MGAVLLEEADPLLKLAPGKGGEGKARYGLNGRAALVGGGMLWYHSDCTVRTNEYPCSHIVLIRLLVYAGRDSGTKYSSSLLLMPKSL